MSADVRKTKRGAHPPSGPSKVSQSAAVGTRVSDIVNRFGPGNPIGIPGPAAKKPRFIDVSAEDYHTMMNRITDANTQFAQLPSRLKGMFGNNLYQMLRFVENPDNRPRALELGLVIPTPEEASELAKKAAKARRAEQVDLIREAMTPLKPDPEAQPDYKPKKGADAT